MQQAVDPIRPRLTNEIAHFLIGDTIIVSIGALRHGMIERAIGGSCIQKRENEREKQK
jgi:hypothetical protein